MNAFVMMAWSQIHFRAVAVRVVVVNANLKVTKMVRVKASIRFPGGRQKLTLALWGDKVYANKTYITLVLTKPRTRHKYISVRLKELTGYEYTKKSLESIYRKYSLLAEQTIKNYSKEIAAELNYLKLIGGS